MSEQQLAEELDKRIIRKLKKRKVRSPFIDNIWGAYIIDMHLIRKFNKWIHFSLCVIEILSKYAWVIPLKDKKSFIITNAFQKNLKESNRSSNKIWVDKGNEFHNIKMKSFLENNVEMHSTQNEGKSVVPERLIRTLKNKIFKCTTSISKNKYLDKSDDIVNKYNNTYHRTIKMKSIDVKSELYVDSSKEFNDEVPKFEIGDIVRISK